MHCHVSPCILPRWGSAVDVARAATVLHYAGIVLCAHHASTFREAALTGQVTEGVRVIGSITLNRACGGFDPDCVRLHLSAGVRLFSLPTFDAPAHIRKLGAGRSLKGEVVKGSSDRGVAMLDGGSVREDLLRVLDLLAAHHAVLYSGHVDTEELEAVAAETAVRELQLVINHPFFLASPEPSFWDRLPGSIRVQFAAVNDPTDPRLPPIGKVVDVTRRIGPNRCMLGSQASAPVHPLERIDQFCLELGLAGLSEAEVETMASSAPSVFVERFLARDP